MGLFQYLTSTTYQLYLNIDQQFDSRISPNKLITQLQNKSNLKKFIKLINKPTTNSNKIIRRLHVCNLLIMYSDIFTSLNNSQLFSDQIHIPLSVDDKWLNDQFIRPYFQFLLKCSNQFQKYTQCKKALIKEDKSIFDQLFFIINLLKLLFKCTNKISLLGKFYKNRNLIVWQGVIQMIAIQSKQLYFPFKTILIKILSNTQKYLFTPQLQLIMKNILMQDLADINQQMKSLLLGKQFFPYGKAIGIKLFRIDQATTQLQNTMRGIVTDHCQTNRRLEKQEISNKLFNHHNGFNIKYFQETLRGTAQSQPLFKAFGKKNNNQQKPMSEEVVESSEEEDPEMTNSKQLADTHQSNLNKVQNF